MSACPWCQYHTGHAETCLARPKPVIDDCAVTGFQRSCPVHGDRKPIAPHFDGETYEPAKDHARLSGQLAGVLDLMRDGRWRTLAEIAAHVEGSEAGVSARLRDLRKPRFGGYEVQRQRLEGGLYRYRLDVEAAKESAA